MDDLLKHFRELGQKYTFTRSKETRCPYCSMQCSMILHEEISPFSRKYSVTPNKADSVSQGRMCVKGMEAHTPLFHKDRLKTPLLRKQGGLHPVSWRTAMQWFKHKVKGLQKQFGKHSVGVYGGGSLTNEESYLLGKFARVALQTPFIDYNGRFCMSSAATAGNQAFGIDRGFTNPLSDIPLAKCIILAGTNIADCQPTMMPYLRKAKSNGAFLIAVDPRVTGTAKIADLHLQIRPGTDAYLVNGMLKIIVEEGYVNYPFIKKHTEGSGELLQFLHSVDLNEISQVTGVHVESIFMAARQFGQAESGMVLTARGVEQHAFGVQNVRNYINLVLITGKIGKPGSGYGAVTGQANGQGGREHGQKADQLPGYRSIENREHRKHIAKVWKVKENQIPSKGVSAYEMFESMMEDKLKGLIVMSSNPVVSNPNAHLIEEALGKLDFLVVVDLFLSETAEMADLVLPGASHLEDEGTITNLEGRVLLRMAVQPLSGQVKLDWQILQEMARVLGKGDKFQYSSAEEIFEELRLASKGGIADYSGITYERIQQEDGIFWPCPAEQVKGTARLFEDSRFYHGDGKARFLTVPHVNLRETPDDKYPLILTTGRVMHHYLSGVQTRRTPPLDGKAPEPFLQIHPETARRFTLEDGQKAWVESRRGKIKLTVKISKDIRKDTVFVPFHWGEEQCINLLTLPELDPQSRMPSFKACAVSITPVNFRDGEIEKDKENREER